MSNWLWILGGSAMQIPAVEEAHCMGYKVIVTDRDPLCRCREFADRFNDVDIFDIDRHLDLLSFMVKQCQIEGVIASGIDCPETAAAMQEFLRKPTAPREVARICHNKKEFRKAMRVLGYPCPAEHDVVVKPIYGSGSRGVRLYVSTDEHQVEERWHGSEHTVETVFDIEGKFHPCFITDRHFDYSGGYALETVLRHPSILPYYVQRKAYQIAESLGRDLGVNHGPFKLDIVVTDTGVRVIEATTRWAGGWDGQYLVPAATGKNILRAGILTCVGSPLDGSLTQKWNKVDLSESLWPPPGKIVSIEGTEEARAIPGVEQIIFRRGVGDYVRPYIDCGERVVFIIVSGESEEEVKDIMARAKEKIHIEVAQEEAAL